MIVNLLISISCCWILPDNFFRPVYKSVVNVQGITNYASNRLSLILLYFILNAFKRTQIMIDPKYDTVDKMKKVMNRSVCIGRAVIIINLSAIIYKIIIDLQAID